MVSSTAWSHLLISGSNKVSGYPIHITCYVRNEMWTWNSYPFHTHGLYGYSPVMKFRQPLKWQFCTITMQHIICIWCRIRSCLHYIVKSILTDNVIQVGSLCLCHIGCTEWLMDSRQNTKPEWGDINQQRCSWHHHYRCYAMLLFTVLTHETARYGEVASAILKFFVCCMEMG